MTDKDLKGKIASAQQRHIARASANYDLARVSARSLSTAELQKETAEAGRELTPVPVAWIAGRVIKTLPPAQYKINWARALKDELIGRLSLESRRDQSGLQVLRTLFRVFTGKHRRLATALENAISYKIEGHRFFLGRSRYLQIVMDSHINLVNNDEPYERLATVAERLGIRYRTLLRWSRRTGFPVIRLPEGNLRARPSEVGAWLEQFQVNREVSNE
jgi:hypothetical protein